MFILRCLAIIVLGTQVVGGPVASPQLDQSETTSLGETTSPLPPARPPPEPTTTPSTTEFALATSEQAEPLLLSTKTYLRVETWRLPPGYDWTETDIRKTTITISRPMAPGESPKPYAHGSGAPVPLDSLSLTGGDDLTKPATATGHVVPRGEGGGIAAIAMATSDATKKVETGTRKETQTKKAETDPFIATITLTETLSGIITLTVTANGTSTNTSTSAISTFFQNCTSTGVQNSTRTSIYNSISTSTYNSTGSASSASNASSTSTGEFLRPRHTRLALN